LRKREGERRQSTLVPWERLLLANKREAFPPDEKPERTERKPQEEETKTTTLLFSDFLDVEILPSTTSSAATLP